MDKQKKKQVMPSWARLLVGTVVIVGLLVVAFFLLKHYGILEKFDSKEKIIAIINEHKAVSFLIFIGIQFLQATFIPIPAVVTTVAGALVFGPFFSGVLSLAGIIPASIFSFFLGRLAGKPFVAWIAGRDTMEKYLEKVKGKENTVFFTMFMLPFFPDDILCSVAGITKMKFSFFLTSMLITRPLAVFGTTLGMYFITDENLKLWEKPWGIALIVVGLIICAVALFISWKYSDQIQQFCEKRLISLKEWWNKKFSRKVKTEELHNSDSCNKITTGVLKEPKDKDISNQDDKLL